MVLLKKREDLAELVDKLNFKQKVDRSLGFIKEAWQEYGDGLVLANSLGKDSVAVWDLAKKVNPGIRGFIITTRFKPKATIQFMRETVSRYPELKVFKNDDGLFVRSFNIHFGYRTEAKFRMFYLHSFS